MLARTILLFSALLFSGCAYVDGIRQFHDLGKPAPRQAQASAT